ncbi:MAG: hypothetical protein ACT4OP_11400 [Actinomycetota bacterium]
MTEGATLFFRLWGVALVAHVVGNWGQPDLPGLVGWLNLGVGLVGAVLVVHPERQLLLLGAGLTLGSLLSEMPVTGNHWLVAGLVSAAILVGRGRTDHFLPVARWILIVFYSFAAFAKLNSGFFDPSVSCAVFYADQSLTSWGLPSFPAGLAPLAIWATLLVEMSVPALLLIRRTRYLGVIVGTGFHVLISYDLGQHFYDFTAVLTPLFAAFLPEEELGSIEAAWERRMKRRRLAAGLWVGIAVLLVVAAVSPLTSVSLEALESIPFLLWIPASLLWLVSLIGMRAPGAKLDSRLRPTTAGVIVLAVLNGLSPYTEVKTAYGFNMYANLVTAQGDTNHLLVPRTFPLRQGYDDPVAIVETSDPGLDLYRQRGYLIAYPQLRQYLASHPDVALSFRRDTETIVVARAADVPELVAPGPWWWRFLPLRAIDTQSPPRCQDTFLPGL